MGYLEEKAARVAAARAIGRQHIGLDPVPVQTPELAEVWCVNDASNAVANIDGVGYCATCFPVAYAEARKAARA